MQFTWSSCAHRPATLIPLRLLVPPETNTRDALASRFFRIATLPYLETSVPNYPFLVTTFGWGSRRT